MRSYLLLFGALLFFGLQVEAAEKIYAYDVDIKIQTDGSMIVTEVIEVQIEGDKIRHGIYRDFPVNYKDKKGVKYKVEFKLRQTLLDGKTVAHKLQNKGIKKRLYLGSASKMAPTGRHRYTISYQTNYQLGFFADHDELYWNAVGPDWLFPIESARVEVHLPANVDSGKIKTLFFTGPYGATGKAAKAGSLPDGAWYETSAALATREGFTIVMTFPKGIIHAPTRAEKMQRLLRDNRSLLAALIGLGLMFAWMVWAWNKVGRDPQAGTIIPRFEAPLGLSPAAVRYVQKMSFDNKAFSAAIVSLAIKGHIRILNPEKKDYSLERLENKDRTHLSAGEKSLLVNLFAEGSDKVKLEQGNHKVLGKAQRKLAYALKKEYKEKLFKINGSYNLPAVGLAGMTILAAVLLGPPPAWLIIGLVLICVCCLIGFAFLLRAPTVSGRKVLDEIEGLKMYLQTAEGERLNRMRSPEMTPEVFESFLPYAFALGVQNQWSEHFKNKLAQAMATGRDSSSGYHPVWYSGYASHNMLGGQGFLNTIGDNLGSQFSSAVVQSSTPPGSSSGSGGGGFSGGGGGGGGGGGW